MNTITNSLIAGTLTISIVLGQSFMGLVVRGSVLETGSRSQASAPPEETARNFYKWYLHALYQSPTADPFKEHKAEVEKYVTARLLQKLAASRRRGGARTGPDVETEYFFGTLDLDSDWEKHITYMRPDKGGETTVVLLHLVGSDTNSDRDLKVVMKKESGLWKIDDVSLWR